jgi:hypothetical protein
MPRKIYPLLPAKITKSMPGGALVHKKYNVYGLEVLILLAL